MVIRISSFDISFRSLGRCGGCGEGEKWAFAPWGVAGPGETAVPRRRSAAATFAAGLADAVAAGALELGADFDQLAAADGTGGATLAGFVARGRLVGLHFF